jgi:general secretion pathway protein N
MQPRSRLIAAGLVTLIAGLVIFFPARVAYQWFAPPTVVLSGISGSIWSGSADQVQAGGVYLRELSWRFKPLPIFKGQLAYAVEAVPVTGFVDTSIAFGFSGAVKLSDLRGSLPLQALEQAANMPGLRGTANLRFERLTIVNGLPVAADGELTIAELLAPLVHRGPIGGYRAEFFTQNSGVIASVEDTDGVVDLAGSLDIKLDRTYQFVALLAPKVTTPPKLRQQMQFLGTANARGQYELRLEGTL